MQAEIKSILDIKTKLRESGGETKIKKKKTKKTKCHVIFISIKPEKNLASVYLLCAKLSLVIIHVSYDQRLYAIPISTRKQKTQTDASSGKEPLPQIINHEHRRKEPTESRQTYFQFDQHTELGIPVLVYRSVRRCLFHDCGRGIESTTRKTCPCNIYLLIPHFYIAKLGYAGVYLFFLIFAPKHRLWVLVRTASARRF